MYKTPAVQNGQKKKFFVWNHVSSMYMFSCRCATAISGSGCCEKTVMSSVYDSMRVSGCVDAGISCV